MRPQPRASPGTSAQWRTLRRYPDGQVGDLFLDATLMPPYAGRQLILLSAYGPSFDISSTDAMTGCLNRRAMDTALRASAGTGHLILLDLNGFKRINDMYGHEAGDHVLRSVAEPPVGRPPSQPSTGELRGFGTKGPRSVLAFPHSVSTGDASSIRSGITRT